MKVYKSAHTYDPVKAGLPADLTLRRAPIEPVLKRLDPLLKNKTDPWLDPLRGEPRFQAIARQLKFPD